MSEREFDTDKFPWVTKQEFVEHYTNALTSYMDVMFRGDDKVHMTDLSAASASFGDAWWAIFDTIDYK